MKVPFDLMTEILQGEMKIFFPACVYQRCQPLSSSLEPQVARCSVFVRVLSVAAGAAHYNSASDSLFCKIQPVILVNSPLLLLVGVLDTWILLHLVSFKQTKAVFHQKKIIM